MLDKKDWESNPLVWRIEVTEGLASYKERLIEVAEFAEEKGVREVRIRCLGHAEVVQSIIDMIDSLE